MGIPQAMNSIADLRRVSTEAYSIKGRVTSLFLSVINSKDKHPLLIMLVIVMAFIPIAFWLIKTEFDIDSFILGATTVISEAIAVVTGIVVVLRRGLSYVNNSLNTIEQAKKTIERKIAEKRASPTQEEVETRKRIDELKQKEIDVTIKLTSAKAQVDSLETRMKKSVEEESLAHFLTERTKSDDYRKHFGLISTIRQDFDDLQRRLKWLQKQKDTTLRKVERIVLYIDDLDRCPPNKVMDVMQAIHLILAYPLFVVVVGVDPRWLVNSLSKTYSAFQGDKKGSTVDPEFWQTTPQNYMEKIFQVPFTLWPMTKTGYSKLIKNLFIPPLGEPLEEAQTITAKTNQSIQQYPSIPEPGPHIKSPEVPLDENYVFKYISIKGENDESADSELKVTPISPEVKSPNYYVHEESLLIKPWETKFAEQLFALMPTPRAAKRFTNTYRILKAPIKPDKLFDFEGTEEYPGSFQVPMLLLAILIGAPAESAVLFPKLQKTVVDGNNPLVTLQKVSNLELTDEAFEKLQEKIKPIITDLTFPDSAKVFAYWIPRVSRFSFDLGRIIQPVDEDKIQEKSGPAVNTDGILINAE
jgi:hypothetical protein